MTCVFYAQLQQLLQQDAIVLATVIHSRGSVPREVGAKMIICGNGQTVQTIGGGAGEAKVIHQAKQVWETGEKRLVEIDLTGNLTGSSTSSSTDNFTDNLTGNLTGTVPQETQGICGGRMQVWLERWSGVASIALVQQILDRLQSGQSVTLVTPLYAEQSPYLLDNEIVLEPESQENQENRFTETIQPPPLLLIVGAGHVGMQLAKVAHLIGFQVAIQDDRPEWANAQHYPDASLIFAEPIATALAQLSTHPQLYAALVTRGYTYDLDALQALLKRTQPCAYIGMIGSPKRVRQVFQAIEQMGIPTEQLTRIRAPIGLDIGALTPAEIAVSIGAELILVHRGGTGRPLRDC